MSTKREPQTREPSPAVLAARRCRVWRRHDLCLRYGEAYVQAQVDARRWQAALPHVVVLHNGPLTDDQRLWAVLTSGPPGTLLHGLSGLTFDGLRGLSPDRLTVVIPGASARRGSRQLATPPGWDVAVRWSTKLGPEDVNPLVLPPRTRVARSVVDAASERVSVRRARVIVLAAAQQQLVRPRQLWDALTRRGRCRNRAVIAESIQDADGGIQSLPEHEFDVLRRRLQLPEPRRQRIVRRRDGRYFLDAEWPQFGVRVEIHGIPHSHVGNWTMTCSDRTSWSPRAGC